MKFQDLLIKISVLLSVMLCMCCEVDIVVINEWDMFCGTF